MSDSWQKCEISYVGNRSCMIHIRINETCYHCCGGGKWILIIFCFFRKYETGQEH